MAGLYEKVDKTLAGGLLPGGASLKGDGDRQAAESCAARGGKWDAATKTCIMPQKQTEAETKKSETSAPSADQVLRSEAGRPSGLTIDGKTYLGLSTQEVEKVVAGQQAKAGGPATQTFEQQALAQQQAVRSQQALTQLGLSPEQIAGVQGLASEAGINWGQAITAGVAGVAPAAIGGAIGGAVVGGGVGSVPASVVGGIGGAIVGFLNGVRSNIKSQQSGEIRSTQKVLADAKANIGKLRMIAQADPSRANEAVELFNLQMARVYQAQRKLQLETQGNLNAFMDDGTEKLVEFDLFLMPGGFADLEMQKLQQALMGDVAMTPEQILMELQTENEQ